MLNELHTAIGYSTYLSRYSINPDCYSTNPGCCFTNPDTRRDICKQNRNRESIQIALPLSLKGVLDHSNNTLLL